jgi:hypothetical protein
MRLEKQELRKRWAELRTLINEWDPVGLIEAGAPHDEYECVVGPVLRMLEENVSASEVAAFLQREFDEHFGVSCGDAAPFAASTKQWYETRWPRTTAG